MWSRRTDQRGHSSKQGRRDAPVDPSERPSQRDDTSRADVSSRPNEPRSSAGTTRRLAGRSLDESELVTLSLRRSDQLLLGFVLIVLVALLFSFRWNLSGGGRSEIEILSQKPREYFYSIDINQASWVEWAQLDGIGEKLAKRIVQDRIERGPFESIEDIRRVRGFGPKMIEKLRPFLKCPVDDATK